MIVLYVHGIIELQQIDYSRHINNFMLTKRDFILRGSYFYEKYSQLAVISFNLNYEIQILDD